MRYYFHLAIEQVTTNGVNTYCGKHRVGVLDVHFVGVGLPLFPNDVEYCPSCWLLSVEDRSYYNVICRAKE